MSVGPQLLLYLWSANLAQPTYLPDQGQGLDVCCTGRVLGTHYQVWYIHLILRKGQMFWPLVFRITWLGAQLKKILLKLAGHKLFSQEGLDQQDELFIYLSCTNTLKETLLLFWGIFFTPCEFVGWLVCQKDFTKTTEWISIKLEWRTFGLGPDKGTYSMILSRRLKHCKTFDIVINFLRE